MVEEAQTFANFWASDKNEAGYNYLYELSSGSASGKVALLCGPSGCGKTHLLKALKVAWQQTWPDRKCHYSTGARFSNKYFEVRDDEDGLRQLRMSTMKYALLLVDDIHDLHESKSVQNGFFRLVHEIELRGNNIVMTSDCLPSGLPLLTRGYLENTFTAQMDYLAVHDRKRLCMDRVGLPEDVAELLASHEPSITKLLARAREIKLKAEISKISISVEFAESQLKSQQFVRPLQTTLGKVRNAVHKFYNLPRDAFRLPTSERTRSAGKIGVYLALTHSRSTDVEVGRMFGVSSQAVKKIARDTETSLTSDKDLRAEVMSLESRLRSEQSF